MCVYLANSIESEMVEKSSAKVLDCDELKFTGAPYSDYSGAMNINNGSGGRVLKGEGEKSFSELRVPGNWQTGRRWKRQEERRSNV